VSRAGRRLLIVLGVVAVIALLFAVVFPWFDRTFVTDPVLGTLTGEPWARWGATGGLSARS